MPLSIARQRTWANTLQGLFQKPAIDATLKDIHCAGNFAVDGAQSIAELELTAATLLFFLFYFFFYCAFRRMLQSDASAQHSHSQAQYA